MPGGVRQAGLTMTGRAAKEWQLHAYTADLLRLCVRPGVLWLHIPNEGLRAARTGAFLKRLGMVPGAADFLIVVRGIAHFLELKTAKGRQSPEQRAFQTWADGSGAAYMIARSPEAVRNILEIWGAVPRSSSRGETRRAA